MAERLDDADLAWQELLEEVSRHVALRDDLDGDVALVPGRVGQLDGRERAAAKLLDDPVALVLQYRVTKVVLGRPAGMGPRRSVGRHQPRIYGRCRRSSTLALVWISTRQLTATVRVWGRGLA